MTNRIILLAHGSSDKRWCETFETLAAPTLNAVADARIAYMELAEPTLDDIVAEGVDAGISRFTIIPLFLAAGRHLRKDVPAMIKTLEETHQVIIKLAPPIGDNPQLGEAIKDVVVHQLADADH